MLGIKCLLQTRHIEDSFISIIFANKCHGCCEYLSESLETMSILLIRGIVKDNSIIRNINKYSKS